jgi:signal transduction histidine kinase
MNHSASLRQQLVNWLLIPLLGIWLFGAVTSYYIAVGFADLAHDRALFDSALTLASQVTVQNGLIAVDQPDTALKMITIDPYDKVYFEVSTARRGIIAGRALPAPPPEAQELPDKPWYQDGKVDGGYVRVASLYHDVRVGPRGILVLVQVAETLKKRRTLASEILAGIAVPQLALISMVMVIGWFGIRRGLSSLYRIQREVRNRSHLDLRPLEEENAPDEIGALVHALNELLGRLDGAISAQNRFIANAAHQLRTPLAGIKTQVEFALRQTDPEQIRHSLQQLQASNDRTIHLVNQLLALARAEPALEAPAASVDLVAIASEAASEWVPAALKKNIDLGFDAAAAAAPVRGNGLLLREMLNNLIDNAIRYTQAGGEITVRVARAEGEVVLSVQDNGPGVPAAERERIFERFHRADAPQGEGCGLGLAIVREIAHLHGGEVFLAETPADAARGALFEVRLPAQA